jgi:hypothetical protein
MTACAIADEEEMTRRNEKMVAVNRCWRREMSGSEPPMSELNDGFVDDVTPPKREPRFRKELEALLNSNCQENGSNTPDFILANYLIMCLDAFDATVNWREKWYSRPEAHLPVPESHP